MLEKCFKKIGQGRQKAISPEQNETNDAMHEIAEQFEKAAKMQQ